MINLPQTSTALEGTPEFFSTKRVNVDTIKLDKIAINPEFCTCITQCIPDLVVFTDTVGTDFYKNDLTSVWMKTVNTVFKTGVPASVGETITGTITNLDTLATATLVDVTHGTLNVGDNYWWFVVDWTKIQGIFGFGRYRVEVAGVSLFGAQTLNEYCSPIYHLKPWSAKLANRTVRIETSQRGKLHHGNDYSNTEVNVAIGEYEPVQYTNQIRLPGSLKFVSNDDESDHLVLDNTERTSYQIKDQVRPKYELTLDLVSSYQAMSVIFDDLFSSPVAVTDYNVYNWVADPRDNYANQFKSIPLERESTSFDGSTGAMRRSFKFSMKYAQDNIFKTNN